MLSYQVEDYQDRLWKLMRRNEKDKVNQVKGYEPRLWNLISSNEKNS